MSNFTIALTFSTDQIIEKYYTRLCIIQLPFIWLSNDLLIVNNDLDKLIIHVF